MNEQSVFIIGSGRIVDGKGSLEQVDALEKKIESHELSVIVSSMENTFTYIKALAVQVPVLCRTEKFRLFIFLLWVSNPPNEEIKRRCHI